MSCHAQEFTEIQTWNMILTPCFIIVDRALSPVDPIYVPR